MNDFFSSTRTSLNFPESQNTDPLSDRPSYSESNCKMEKSKCTCYYFFSRKSRRSTFRPVTLADVVKEINILNSSKAIQEADLSVKLLKDNKG